MPGKQTNKEIKIIDGTETSASGLLFFKEVAKYFMDFLETDFHKRKLPRRSIKYRDGDNLLIGLNLQKYESFNKLVLELIQKNFDKDVLGQLEKGVHKTTLPKNLLELIQLQVGKIQASQITSVVDDIADEIEKSGTLHAEEYDIALSSSVEAAAQIIHSELVDPFIKSIEKPLQNLHLGEEDDIYRIEEELTSVLVRQLENKISEILNLFIAGEKVNLQKELKNVFVLSEVKATLETFFEDLRVADLFAEVFEMQRNMSILDKQDFYLYFGDISFNNTKYPIFYIPVSVTRQGEGLQLDFDAQIYINKRALEYIVQEYNVLKGTRGNLKNISERIIYIAQHAEDLQTVLSDILIEIGNLFEVSGQVSFFSEETLTAKGASIRISNSCYLCLFDKSDEALVNDYEDILQLLSEDGGQLADSFNKLLGDFLYNNPESINPEVEGEWENTETSDRLVAQSPIPLNAEQLQILSAIKKDKCKYMIVEGPPGTGKSHTITAIIFDSILRDKSVLVLSDKKEALDVVEKNITQTMNKVRFDKNFQNPILRLGKTGNTYGQILAKGTIESIKTQYKAVKKDFETIVENIDKSTNSLKEDLEAEIIAYGGVNVQEVQELVQLEDTLHHDKLPFDINELLTDENSALELAELRASLELFVSQFNGVHTEAILKLLGINQKNINTAEDYKNLLRFLTATQASVKKVQETFTGKLDGVNSFTSFNQKDLVELNKFIKEYTELKGFLIGFLFSKEKVAEIDLRFMRTLCNSYATPHDHLTDMKTASIAFEFIAGQGREINKQFGTEFDFIALVHYLLHEGETAESLHTVLTSAEEIQYFEDFSNKYPETAKVTGINMEKLNSLEGCALLSVEASEFDKQLRYINLRQKITKDFSSIPDLNYALKKKNIEDLVITRVAYLLDGRLIKFYENNKADAETLRNIIRNKQRFPRDEFQKLKEAFPCILAGIRDYAEYIPLEQDMFDLVIIDEASQVSVAQAFPALLRAKKVLILGDKKQFSNIKAAQARGDTNREYLHTLEQSFRRNVSNETTKLVRLSKFNIKTSILEFFAFISNYETQLKKHFRGYKEIISYSNKFFYQEKLQVMKIRGKAIDDVLKFSYVEAGKEDEVYPNANIKEVEAIIAQLRLIKEEEQDVSVGIITPHTNQQKLLMEQINKLPERDYYFDNLKLKIMTFDTCQGEERDIIFYSMVATKDSDKLWGVFIKDLKNVDIEEDGQIKAQRLNVGFSRAKECMHFILSKPLDDYNGSIGDALRHYFYVLEEAKKERSVAETDARSQKEPEVLNWFYQTGFWKKNNEAIEFIPQFEIGKYLKQLDPMYSHPHYKVDFLLVYRDARHKVHNIVIEYDGFQEHFKDTEVVNAHNYKDYYSDGDVYRQKVLESYGYKFLRINRFNVGENPIKTLDDRLARLVRDEPSDNSVLNSIHMTVEGLQNGAMKECPKCKEIRPYADFKDSSLLTGVGRFCSTCKNNKITTQAAIVASRPAPVLTDKKCPRCGSPMILRNGRRGKFYGCSRFPYCRGTRN